ncbi:MULTISPECIES: HyaD/HybD family hydrogenase maturation endopeptidase [Providencia]|uniref:Hydrogenase maturation protease n=1 Tax=Providencia heimbachae ATCC 35613 TaxID=1354272 RepID=A0A1B7JYB8_9GAMM|nr:HyaD/HybD family hydrogenase maturation endopeptidase [Providencia heimbachae]MBP6122944.1 HyaD/HybD family hydrogenase maturation endopeptidase [Providencia sp.]NIH23811.1 HyaD/HybD family hydrogenase maturation endopeptidase [Providencia heimbachae]OAT52913.1 hydrogenase maturation protease [Providencia heimbachae ATCC 35613]QCJ71257.1 HyaD/HybD family hydrogenase maturation endopeptidase [Providencia heimbachae]SQH14552.1 Hydrogenase 2 maturation protease [Providencia heimbachae]
MRILVLGVGNILLSDEGIGVRIVEALEERYHLPECVEVLDGGTAGMELMGAMADRDHLIIADVVLSSQKPGNILVLRDDEVPALFTRKISPHQLGLSDVLSALHLTDEFPQRLTLVGIVPESLEPRIGLTAVGKAAFEPALQTIIEILRSEGLEIVEKEESLHV